MDYAFQGERHLWRHHRQLISYNALDFEMLAKRGSMVKVSAAIFAEITKQWDLLDQIEEGLNNLSTALQMVDDIIDWETDYQNSIYNYPVVQAYKSVSADNTDILKEESLEKTIFSANVISPILDQIQFYLETGKKYFERVNAPNLVCLISNLNNNVLLAQTSLKSKNDCSESDHSADLTKEFRKMLDPRLQH